MSYEIEFEKIMKLKEELLKSNNNASRFSETKNEYIVKDFVVRKRKYKHVGQLVHELNHEIKQKELKMLSLRKLYLMSRSNIHDDALKFLFDEIAGLKNRLLKIDTKALFVSLSSNEKSSITLDQVGVNTKTTPNNNKKQKIKKFLFDTYEQCISNKRSEPFYMTKEDVVHHIKNYNQEMLKKMPPKFEKLKKTDLCKVIFS